MGRGILLTLLSAVLISCGRAEWQTPDSVYHLYNNKDQVTVSTFNLKFYGTGGGFNIPGIEYRDPYLKAFILQELAESDIVVFTEVVEVKRLAKLVAERWQCAGYDRQGQKGQDWHQHITLCYNPNKYRVEKYDGDWVIPEHALGSRHLRPALQAKVCHIQGQCFLQILGVHLKAGAETDKRLEQIKILRDDLKNQSSPLPTMVVGDFNAYEQGRNGKSQSDIQLFEGILSESGRKFRTLNIGISTYGSGKYGHSYDHMVVSPEITAQNVKAYSACASKFDPAKSIIPYSKYQIVYSDHCFLTANLKIKP